MFIQAYTQINESTVTDIAAARAESNNAGLEWEAVSINRALSPTVRICDSEEVMSEIGKLRYELYIDRDQKRYCADCSAKIFLETADQYSLHFYSLLRGSMCGSLRLTLATQAGGDLQLERLVSYAKCLGAFDTSVVLASRFALRPDWRARSTLVALFQEAYLSSLLQGARLIVLSSRLKISDLYARFGFVQGDDTFVDSVAGTQMPMHLDLLDVEHLARVDSPLMRAPGLSRILANLPSYGDRK